jgi:hypothetical protein
MTPSNERERIVKLIVSRWDSYKLIANSLGYDPKEECRSISDQNSDSLIKAEQRLLEDKYQLKEWIRDPPAFEYILQRLHESNTAYIRCISSFYY